MTVRTVAASRSRCVASIAALIGIVGTVMPVSLYAQATGGAAQGSREAVANSRLAVDGSRVTITYDLTGSLPSGTFTVSLAISLDDGQTFGLTPSAVSGDIGAAVAPGTGKRIVWDAAKDTESLQLNRLQFRVTAIPTAIGAAAGGTASGSAAPQPAAQRPNPPQRPPSQSASRSRGKLFSSLALIGVGVAVGGAAAAGPLRTVSDDPFLSDCVQAYGASNCTSFSKNTKRPNKPLTSAAIGIAGTGAFLLIRAGKSSPEIVITSGPKGLGVFRTMRF